MGAKKILLVEDDFDIRENMREVLEAEGYEVKTSGEGAAALDELKSNSNDFGMILLDLMMSGMNGWEFLEILHNDQELKEKREVPVIVITAAGEKSPSNVAGFLKKPFDLSHLLKVVEQHCGLPLVA